VVQQFVVAQTTNLCEFHLLFSGALPIPAGPMARLTQCAD
jgi:hypothetical protein